MASPNKDESQLSRSHIAMLQDLLHAPSSSPSIAPPLHAPPSASSSSPQPHPRPQHHLFLPYPPPAPPPAPPDQGLHFFNHLADVHPPLPYSTPSLTASSETDFDDPLLMAFLSTPIDVLLDSSLNYAFGSRIHQGSDIRGGDASNVSQGGDSSGSGKGNIMVGLPSSKGHGGQHLVGDEVYDIDVRVDRVARPQLEVKPITKYVSDPRLVLGRQIAVNTSYICYGLRTGNIRILNVNTALRSLLRGHTQRITDMAFFADDVHILASASSNGRVFVWNINEGPGEEDKAQISSNIVTAIQIIGDKETLHPRLCWHPHKQEILMVAIGNRIFKVDTSKVGKGKSFSAEEPLKCPANKLLKGVQIVGKHDAMITDLSMCQWMASRLASASTDGVVKIWEDRKPLPVAVLRPYDGRPVNSVTFLTAPHRPEHIILFTGGPLNRDIKIWTSTHEDGWLLPSDSESWQCTQTLKLKISSEESLEDAFFNQIVAVPLAGIILLANAKKNALYAVHIDYGQCPASTRMDYITEFMVTMPILSLTVTSESRPDGERILQVYCMQTQAIQQYVLALSQCLPPILDNRELEKALCNDFREFDSLYTEIFGKSVHRMKPDLISCSATLVQPICPCTVGSMPATVPTVHVPSSEITGFPKATAVLVTTQSDLSPPVTAEQTSSSFPLPLSPRLCQRSSGFRSPQSCLEYNTTVADHKIDHPMSSKMEIMKGDLAEGHSSSSDICKDNHILAPKDLPVIRDPPMIFKQPTHLITPSEILSKASSSPESQTSLSMVMGACKVCDVINNETDSCEVEVKVVGEKATNQNRVYDFKGGACTVMAEHREKFYSQASDISIHVARDFGINTCRVEGAHLANNVVNGEQLAQLPSNTDEIAAHFTNNDFPMLGESENSSATPQSAAPPAEVMARKGTACQPSGPSYQSQSLFNSTDSSNDLGSSSGAPSGDAAYRQLSSMQEMLDKLVSIQKETKKQMTAIASVPFNQEGKRLEASLGRNLENMLKATEDALWAGFLKENAKHSKLEQEHTQQITRLINDCLNQDFPSILEESIKKEIASIGPAVVRAITPTIEKSVSSAIAEPFQKGVGDKAFHQLEKGVSSKLEAAVARQIQLQFQTSGKAALRDSLRSSLETSLVPVFERSCKAMFEQVDVTVHNGLMKHIKTMLQQFESAHSPLAIALRDALNSASSISQVFSGELTDGQQTLMAIATAGAGSKGANTLVTRFSGVPVAGLHEFVEEPIDPTKQLSRLLAENRYEEAFTEALHKNDVSIVSWLCSQVDLQKILSINPLPLSQGVLAALIQQLACDFGKETYKKVRWMTDVAVVINPLDPMITMHVRPICEQVYQILNHQQSLQSVTPQDAGNIRLLMHVINSVLTTCK